jgi:hypothetical protein
MLKFSLKRKEETKPVVGTSAAFKSEDGDGQAGDKRRKGVEVEEIKEVVGSAIIRYMQMELFKYFIIFSFISFH